jgi:hypothetical protein
MSEQLSWRRLKALLRNESIGEYRIWLVASAVTAGAMLLGATYAVPNLDLVDPPYYRIAYFVALVILGTLQASLSFRELHDKSQNTSFLLLPASALEKTLAPLLTTTIVLIVYLLVFTTAASAAIEGVNWLLYRRTNELFDPVAPEVWVGIPRYLVVQSWFFLGAAWFRKARYLKTLLAIMVGGLALAVLALLFALVAGWVTVSSSGLHAQANVDSWLFSYSDSKLLRVSLATLWLVVQPLFCWWLAWLRIRDTQVSHGV